MNLLKSLAIYFFDLLDIFIHQKRILLELKKNHLKINSFIDVGAHKGIYTDLILRNFKVKKVFMFEPQKNIFNFIKKKYKKFRNIKVLNNAISNNEKMKNIYINISLILFFLKQFLSMINSVIVVSFSLVS